MDSHMSKIDELHLIDEYIELFSRLDQLNSELEKMSKKNEHFKNIANQGLKAQKELEELQSKDNKQALKVKRGEKMLESLKKGHKTLIDNLRKIPTKDVKQERRGPFHQPFLKKEIRNVIFCFFLIVVFILLSNYELASATMLIVIISVIIMLPFQLYGFLKYLFNSESRKQARVSKDLKIDLADNEIKTKQLIKAISDVKNNIKANKTSIEHLQEQLSFLRQQQDNTIPPLEIIEKKVSNLSDRLKQTLSKLQSPKYLEVIPDGFRDAKILRDIRVILNSTDVVNLDDACSRYLRMISTHQQNKESPDYSNNSNAYDEHYSYKNTEAMINIANAVYSPYIGCYIAKTLLKKLESPQLLFSLIKESLVPNEVVLFAIKGVGKQFLVVTNDQIIISKSGLLATSNAFGGQSLCQIPIDRVTSLSYKSIGFAAEGVLLVHAIGYQESIIASTEQEREFPGQLIDSAENAIHIYNAKDPAVTSVVNFVNQHFIPLVSNSKL